MKKLIILNLICLLTIISCTETSNKGSNWKQSENVSYRPISEEIPKSLEGRVLGNWYQEFLSVGEKTFTKTPKLRIHRGLKGKTLTILYLSPNENTGENESYNETSYLYKEENGRLYLYSIDTRNDENIPSPISDAIIEFDKDDNMLLLKQSLVNELFGADDSWNQINTDEEAERRLKAEGQLEVYTKNPKY